MFSTICCTIIGLNIATAHIDADIPQNNFNPGLYFQTSGGLVFGSYYNSIYRQTTYVGFTSKIGKVEVVTGVGTGYNDSVIPMILPSMKFGPLRVMYLPKMGITGSHIMHFSIEREFK